MIQEHQITPPPELVEQWLQNTRSDDCIGAYPANYEQLICTQAARWGADQELNECCEWIYKLMDRGLEWSMDLRIARRPKPPSLKAGAIEVLDELDGLFELPAGHYNTILRALEQLDDSL